jgi:hypothetical protein
VITISTKLERQTCIDCQDIFEVLQFLRTFIADIYQHEEVNDMTNMVFPLLLVKLLPDTLNITLIKHARSLKDD